jgi:hypothetical protein
MGIFRCNLTPLKFECLKDLRPPLRNGEGGVQSCVLKGVNGGEVERTNLEVAEEEAWEYSAINLSRYCPSLHGPYRWLSTGHLHS